MLDQARDKGVYSELFEADLTRTIDIPTDSYDAVISVGTFTHSHIGPDRLDEVLRLVKPGGLACITVNGDSYLADGYGAKFDSMVADGLCTIYDEREEEYMIARNIKSRIVILKKG